MNNISDMNSLIVALGNVAVTDPTKNHNKLSNEVIDFVVENFDLVKRQKDRVYRLCGNIDESALRNNIFESVYKDTEIYLGAKIDMVLNLLEYLTEELNNEEGECGISERPLNEIFQFLYYSKNVGGQYITQKFIDHKIKTGELRDQGVIARINSYKLLRPNHIYNFPDSIIKNISDEEKTEMIAMVENGSLKRNDLAFLHLLMKTPFNEELYRFLFFGPKKLNFVSNFGIIDLIIEHNDAVQIIDFLITNDRYWVSAFSNEKCLTCKNSKVLDYLKSKGILSVGLAPLLDIMGGFALRKMFYFDDMGFKSEMDRNVNEILYKIDDPFENESNLDNVSFINIIFILAKISDHKQILEKLEEKYSNIITPQVVASTIPLVFSKFAMKFFLRVGYQKIDRLPDYITETGSFYDYLDENNDIIVEILNKQNFNIIEYLKDKDHKKFLLTNINENNIIGKYSDVILF